MNKILYVPDPILRQTSKKIKKITSKEIDISKKMIDLMLKAPGVGLAANQIGILKKIVTINLPNENKFLMVENTINKNFAGTGIAKFVAGKGWKNASKEVKTEYIKYKNVKYNNRKRIQFHKRIKTKYCYCCRLWQDYTQKYLKS